MEVLVGRTLSEPTWTDMPKQEGWRWAMQHACNGRRFFNPEGSQAILDLSYLVEMEVKCAYVSAKELNGGKPPVLKSLKHGTCKQSKLRRQLESLLMLGLDRVFLLDLVGGIPSEANTFDEAFAWMALSFNTVDAHHQRLAGAFPADLPTGHIAVTFGPGRGHTEATPGLYPCPPHPE